MDILYEDNHLIAVNKPNNILIQSDQTGDPSLLEMVRSYIRKSRQKPGNVYLGMVQRLDRPVSGVVVFARTSKAAARMNDIFRHHSISKVYLAQTSVAPDPAAGSLKHLLVKNQKQNRSILAKSGNKDAKEARLTYKLLGKNSSRYLLEIALETGRHHQIRVQLASIGCPVFGDLKYGHPEAISNAGILLHAWRLSFIHPVKKEPLSICAPVPGNSFWSGINERGILEMEPIC